MKQLSIDKLVDEAMTRLFQFAEYVLRKTAGIRPSVECSPADEESSASVATSVPSVSLTQQEPLSPTIRFKHEDRMVEGELFG